LDSTLKTQAMTDKIDTNQIRGIVEQATYEHPGCPKVPAVERTDASLDVAYAGLIEKAREAAETDAAAVLRARQLLATGGLVSPENALEAARNMIRLGI